MRGVGFSFIFRVEEVPSTRHHDVDITSEKSSYTQSSTRGSQIETYCIEPKDLETEATEIPSPFLLYLVL